MDDTQALEEAYLNGINAAVVLEAAADDEPAEDSEAEGSSTSAIGDTSSSWSGSDGGDSDGEDSGDSQRNGGSPQPAGSEGEEPGEAGQQLKLGRLATHRSSPSERLRFVVGCLRRLLPRAR